MKAFGTNPPRRVAFDLDHAFLPARHLPSPSICLWAPVFLFFTLVSNFFPPLFPFFLPAMEKAPLAKGILVPTKERAPLAKEKAGVARVETRLT